MSKPTVRLYEIAKIVIFANLCTAFLACGSQSGQKAPQGSSSVQSGGAGSDIHETGARADGVGSGGGGDTVICYKKKKIVDMEAFDLWVAPMNFHSLTFYRKPLGQNDISKPEAKAYMDQVQESLSRLKRVDPMMAQHIQSQALAFSADKIDKPVADGGEFQKVEYIPRNDDGGAVEMPDVPPAGCDEIKIERMFWQVDKPRLNQAAYQIVPRLWKAAPESVKAVVVRHESIWRLERKIFGDVTTSLNTQVFNAFTYAQEFTEYGFDDYAVLLAGQTYPDGKNWYSNGGIFSYKHHGFVYRIPKIEIAGPKVIFVDDPKVKVRGELYYTQAVKVNGDEIHASGPVKFDRDYKVIQLCVDPMHGPRGATTENLVINGRVEVLKEKDELFFETRNGVSVLVKILRDSKNCEPPQRVFL